MMSFLALNLQVAEAWVAMHEMPIATAAKEITIRQAIGFFSFLEDVCANAGINSTKRCRWFQRADRRLARKQTAACTDL